MSNVTIEYNASYNSSDTNMTESIVPFVFNTTCDRVDYIFEQMWDVKTKIREAQRRFHCGAYSNIVDIFCSSFLW